MRESKEEEIEIRVCRAKFFSSATNMTLLLPFIPEPGTVSSGRYRYSTEHLVKVPAQPAVLGRPPH